MNTVQDCIDDAGVLRTEDARKRGIPKSTFYQFVQKNQLERLAHGIYLSPESWEDAAYVLHLRCPQAVFSHDEALYYHDFVDREPMQPTLTIYSGYNTQKLTASGVKVYTVKKELLPIGKETITNAFGHELPMYDLERTICDLVRSRSHFDFQDFQSALKRYAARKDKDLNKLMQYTRLFRVEKVLRTYLEILI